MHILKGLANELLNILKKQK